MQPALASRIRAIGDGDPMHEPAIATLDESDP